MQPQSSDLRGLPSPWPSLGLCSSTMFLVMLDAATLFVALNGIRTSFATTSAADLSWVLNTCAIMFGALLVPAGPLADLCGCKHLFVIGVALITSRQSGWLQVALVLPIVAIVGGCKEEAKVEEEIVRPVKIAVVEMAASGRALNFSGVVRPRIESAVGFRVAGKIVERLVNVGDRVEIDQVIARLDDTDLKLAEKSSRAAVSAARSRRDVASDNLERGRVLLPKAIVTQAAYDTRRNEMDAAASALESVEAQLSQAVNAVGYATLRADKAGIVTAVTGEPGQVVSAGQPVITLAHAGEIEVAVAVPEQDAGLLMVGQRAKVTLWAQPRESIEGRIREIAGQADAASRTYSVRIAVIGSPQTMRLGMTASVAIWTGDEAAQLVVPLAALTESDGSPVVFVVDRASKTVRKTPVAVGAMTSDGVTIANGLHAGELVVTAGVQFLRDGMRVRLPGERPHARSDKPI